MKAKLVRENINFERGGEGHIYTKIGIGERERVLKWLDEVADDIQFQKDEPEYMGFLNLAEDYFLTPEMAEPYRLFLKSWRSYLPDLKERNLYLLSFPDPDETIFYDESSISGVEAIKESFDFERGRSPKAALGIGMISRIPLILLEQDLKSGYGIDGFPGTIIDIIISGPSRIRIKFHHDKKIRNLETNKMISKEKYAKLIAEQAGVWNLFTNFYHAHGVSYIFFYTLDKKYIGLLPKGGVYDYDDLENDPLKESLDFERGKEPKEAMGIGHQAQIEKKAKSIEWDWDPFWEPEKWVKEEVVDVIPYPQEQDPNIFIKISKLTDVDGNSGFVGVNNIGEPYAGDPEFWMEPKQALIDGKLSVDLFFVEGF